MGEVQVVREVEEMGAIPWTEVVVGRPVDLTLPPGQVDSPCRIKYSLPG